MRNAHKVLATGSDTDSSMAVVRAPMLRSSRCKDRDKDEIDQVTMSRAQAIVATFLPRLPYSSVNRARPCSTAHAESKLERDACLGNCLTQSVEME